MPLHKERDTRHASGSLSFGDRALVQGLYWSIVGTHRVLESDLPAVWHGVEVRRERERAARARASERGQKTERGKWIKSEGVRGWRKGWGEGAGEGESFGKPTAFCLGLRGFRGKLTACAFDMALGLVSKIHFTLWKRREEGERGRGEERE